MTWLISVTAAYTGWHLDYIKAIPLYQLLQLTAGMLSWEGTELKWKSSGADKRKLSAVLSGNKDNM